MSPSIAHKWYYDGFTPDRIYSVSEWADKNRLLSRRSSSEPGPYRTMRTPYAKEIMDVLSSSHPAREIVFMKASQVGGTEVGLNWLGYIIDHSPAPVLLVNPTVEMAKRSSKQRIDPLIEESPVLRTKVQDPRSRDSSNTMLMKDFIGGTLIMTGANSAVGLRSMPAKYIFFDECDAFPSDADNEGSPIELAKARARTFTNRKFFYVSTPTIQNRSEIERLFNSSDQRFFHLPCPACGFFQRLEFSQLKWEKDNPDTAVYHCIDCRTKIENWQKTDMLEKGRWVASNPGPNVLGFHLNALYSPVGWYSWPEIARDWLKSQKNNDLRRTFINTVLGETWADRGEAPDWHRLYERRERYKIGQVPSGAVFLTAGADVQKDRIEVEVVGWGRNRESWSIQYLVFPGDTSSPDPWLELERLLSTSFKTWTDALLPIRMLAVDSGYNTQVVYDWCRRYPLSRVIATKGQNSLEAIIGHPKGVELKQSGKKIKHGLKSWPIGVSLMKSELYGFLRQDAPKEGESFPPGFCHFPEYEPAYFEMLTAEELMVKIVKGYKRFEWQKVRERNEALDCRILARAAAAVVGLDRFTEAHWSQIENEMGLLRAAERKETMTAPVETEIMRRKPSEFWKGRE